MTKYKIVKFDTNYAVQKTFLWVFVSYIDLTKDGRIWLTWGRRSVCLENCLGTKEQVIRAYNLAQPPEDHTYGNS